MMYPWIQNKTGNHRNNRIISLGLGLSLIVVLAVGLLGGTHPPTKVSAAPPQADQVEPEAGTWQTWVLESGSQLRLAAPPDEQDTVAEIEALKELMDNSDQAALDQIAFWNTGPAAYRWNEMAIAEALKVNMGTPVAGRLMALLNVAI